MTREQDRLPAFILAGGSSRRFGSDKARAPLGGEPLIRHVAAGLEPLAARVTVVADRADRYADLGFRTLGDDTPGRGPLGGLSRALSDLEDGEGWLLLAPCDVVGVRREWLERLLDARRPGAGAVAFWGEVWQPLPGLYHRAIRDAVAERVTSGRRSLWGLMSRVDAEPVPLPAGWQEEVAQVNTPEQLLACEARLGMGGTKGEKHRWGKRGMKGQ